MTMMFITIHNIFFSITTYLSSNYTYVFIMQKYFIKKIINEINIKDETDNTQQLGEESGRGWHNSLGQGGTNINPLS